MKTINYGALYSGLFQQYVAAHEAHQRALKAITAAEAVVRDDDQSASVAGYAFTVCDLTNTNAIEKIAEDVVRLLACLAAHVFAAPGTQLTIDVEALKHQFVWPVRSEPVNFNASAVWDELARLYGAGQGEEVAFRDVAKKIVSAFRISGDDELVTKTGRVVLSHSIWLNSYDKPRTVLSYSSLDNVVELLRKLRAVALWGDDSRAALDLEHASEHMQLSRGVLTSRERLTISECLHIVTYHSRFEFQLSQAFAATLQEFLAHYAPQLQEVES